MTAFTTPEILLTSKARALFVSMVMQKISITVSAIVSAAIKAVLAKENIYTLPLLIMLQPE